MDHYGVLGVGKNASPDEIKKAYRRLSKESHPDRHPSTGSGQVRKEAEEKYKQINRAYEVLSDPKKKQMYDQFGSEDGPQFHRGSGGSPFGAGFGDIGDIFETFFGAGARAGRARPSEVQGRDAEVRLSVTLAEAFTGNRKTVRMRKLVTCVACGGSGGKDGAKKVSCRECNGTGQVTRTAQSFFGMIQQSMVCDRCKGSGKVPETPCPTCTGEGRGEGREEVTVEIPRGISDGQTLRVRGKGEAGRQGAIAGDLFVHVRIDPDHRFEREGDDLRASVTIPLTDAVLGTTVSVPTLADPVTLKIPEGTQPGQIFRIKGGGMPILGTSRFGDLYVRAEVEVPKRLSRAERKLWEELRSAGL